jgi:tetratricopeptide (TPR) repeat protein
MALALAAAILALFGAGLWKVASTQSHSIVRGAAVVIVLGLLTVVSRQHSALFADPITLYADTIEKNPDCWMAHFNLGNALVQAGRNQDAAAEFAQTVKLRPQCAEAHNNLGKCFAATDQKASINEFELTVALLPDSAGAHFNPRKEPHAGLDEHGRAVLEEIVRAAPADGCTVIHYEQYVLAPWLRPFALLVRGYLRWTMRGELRDLERLVAAGGRVESSAPAAALVP